MDNNENLEQIPSSPFSSPCSHSDHPKTGVPGVSLHYCDTQSEIHRIVVGDLENNVFFGFLVYKYIIRDPIIR